MTAFILLSLLNQASKETTKFFAPIPRDVKTIVSRLDSQSVAYQYNQKVVLLNSEGAIDKRISVQSDQKALYISDSGFLITVPSKLLHTSINGKSHLFIGPTHRFFNRNIHIFSALNSVTYLGLTSTIDFADYQIDSAVGINHQGNRIAYIKPGNNSSQLQLFTLTNDLWVKDEKSINPYVKDVGLIGVASRINDLLFLDDRHLLFFGQFLNADNLELFSKWENAIPDFRKWKLGPSLGSEGLCFLFVMDIANGRSKSIGKFKIGLSSEFGTPMENTMVLSKDSKSLYIASIGCIVKMEIESIVRSISDLSE